MSILWILVPGLAVGLLFMDSVRRIFSDDDRLMWKLFQSQPVTMIAAATIVGSVIVWGVLGILRVW